jgi:hypothetical protein
MRISPPATNARPSCLEAVLSQDTCLRALDQRLVDQIDLSFSQGINWNLGAAQPFTVD